MIRYFALFALLLIPLLVPSSFGAVNDFDTNKSLFHKGDQLIVSGSVSYDVQVPFVTVQIFNPAKTTFADFNTVAVNSDGSFSVKFTVGGPLWPSDGVYPIKVAYNGKSLEKTIKYQESAEPEPKSTSKADPTPKSTPAPKQKADPKPTPKADPKPKPTPDPKPKPPTDPKPTPEPEFETLKFVVPNFPALDKSPQYYIDRYNDEPSYKSWFDSQFPSHLITDVVGYSQTHVDAFPALDKSPQYYIDRYNDEPSYKSWFDSQFPGQSIYNVLGYADPVSVPDWIKSNAEWWAAGEIDDSTFVSGIEFMIENNIILISSVPSSNASDGQIPDWVKNSAQWWSEDLISEHEFVKSLEFLIREGIISIKQ